MQGLLLEYLPILLFTAIAGGIGAALIGFPSS